MFIRRTTIKSRTSGEPYYTYRLVESERVEGRVKQRTLLNLGRHFELERQQWPALCARIEQLLNRQQSMGDIELETTLEQLAQRYAARILAVRSEQTEVNDSHFVSVDVDRLEVVRPRTVGVEHVALQAAEQLGLPGLLRDLGFNRHQRAAALGNIIGRMTAPGSEQATHRWLQQRSALGELLGYDFEGLSDRRLYEASDLLWKHRQKLEEHLYGAARSLFGFEETVTLYDLTNTYFEGNSRGSELTQRGRSKEKRTDAPLVTLGLVLDGSGFPRHSEVFTGNVAEPKTLEEMLKGLRASPEAIVVMDAGLASEANIAWLKQQGHRYLVVSRKRTRTFDPQAAVLVKETSDQQVRIHRVLDEQTGEVELYCHSQARELKEQAMQDNATARFEQQLESLAKGLHKKGCTKRYDKVLQRIGRLREKYPRAAQHYEIEVEQAPEGGHARSITWKRHNKPGSQATHPGVYCLRTDLQDWDEQRLWQTYTMLTDLEAVFRSLKTELGLRPIHHQKSDRISGHLFISLLAYYLVHTLRVQLKVKGMHYGWRQLREILSTRMRVTVTLPTREGKTLHVRKATRPEPHQQVIYDALGISPQAGTNQRTVQ